MRQLLLAGLLLHQIAAGVLHSATQFAHRLHSESWAHIFTLSFQLILRPNRQRPQYFSTL